MLVSLRLITFTTPVRHREWMRVVDPGVDTRSVSSGRCSKISAVLSIFLKKKFLGDTHVLGGGHWYPCFGFLVTSPLGFKPEWVLPYSLFAQANVMYIPQDPPLVLHLLASWQPACSQSLPSRMCRGGTWLGFERCFHLSSPQPRSWFKLK